ETAPGGTPRFSVVPVSSTIHESVRFPNRFMRSAEKALPQFSPHASEPGLATRAWRFVNVAWLAAYVYVGYKSIQLWSRYISRRNREALFRRQDLRSARAMYATAVRLEGLLIKASQFIATRADILPDEWVSTLSGLHDRVPPRS